jgi:hypothetical protein
MDVDGVSLLFPIYVATKKSILVVMESDAHLGTGHCVYLALCRAFVYIVVCPWEPWYYTGGCSCCQYSVGLFMFFLQLCSVLV